MPAMIPSLTTNLIVLGTLGAIFLGSWVMFKLLVIRSTDMRQWVARSEWANEHRLKLVESPPGVPEPFDKITGPPARTKMILSGRVTTLAELRGSPALGVPISPMHHRAVTRSGNWNVLVRRLETSWPPTGLRPSSGAPSILELFSLISFPHLGSTDRFVVYGTDTAAAQWLSRSAARGLLPPDVGMLLHGDNLVLDFSARPFDEVEFNRMLALAEQLVAHLPAKGV